MSRYLKCELFGLITCKSPIGEVYHNLTMFRFSYLIFILNTNSCLVVNIFFFLYLTEKTYVEIYIVHITCHIQPYVCLPTWPRKDVWGDFVTPSSINYSLDESYFLLKRSKIKCYAHSIHAHNLYPTSDRWTIIKFCK